ncbi:hypothetical protein, partial [Ralstonia pseudosolanacearum]|uniref:hypothetical protein n=1 Tax=Ralstonia pseudosolanacearum TaxID=1310165 RepID=UPI002675D05E
QRYRHVVARKRQHGLTTTLIYATTPIETLPRIANATIGVDVAWFWVFLGSLASDVDRIKIIAMI